MLLQVIHTTRPTYWRVDRPDQHAPFHQIQKHTWNAHNFESQAPGSVPRETSDRLLHPGAWDVLGLCTYCLSARAPVTVQRWTPWDDLAGPRSFGPHRAHNGRTGPASCRNQRGCQSDSCSDLHRRDRPSLGLPCPACRPSAACPTGWGRAATCRIASSGLQRSACQPCAARRLCTGRPTGPAARLAPLLGPLPGPCRALAGPLWLRPFPGPLPGT